ncbi:MAG: UDP-N-acetylmuramyl-tripeptide synthetase [Firmicutes bacterium]|nr:UDP-N-acetylmuramyl-tripeptide synthetase [Bacillota bacterium]
MKLRDYCEKLKSEGLDVTVTAAGCGEGTVNKEALDKEVTGLSCDSRTVTPGTLFVCKGVGFKPEYLVKALENGAAAYVAGPDIRRAMAVLSNMYFCEPWKDVNLVGITGTKGKTTALYYLKSIMEGSHACGKGRFGYLSTIDTYDGVELFESHLTTPEAIELGQRLWNMAHSDIKAAAMEVSSQALKYDRTYGVRFKYGVFTNFGADHIGSTEHPSMEDYFASKLKIFDQCENAIVGMENIRIMDVLSAAKQCRNLTTYRAENVRKKGSSTVFDVTITETVPHQDESPLGMVLSSLGSETVIEGLRLTMPGLFNAENAAAAAAMALKLGATEDEIRSGLLNARAAGRMEFFENKERNVIAISDYAHNELSYEKLLSSAKEEYPGYRLVAVFGCPGGKGYSRRVDLPKVAAKYADFTWITEEDPADEDPYEISVQVLKNLQDFGGKGAICVDRTKAIRDAILNAEPKTVVLIIGKGREQYQHRGSSYDPVESDSELAERFINQPPAQQ